jgi:hypothetical protein
MRLVLGNGKDLIAADALAETHLPLVPRGRSVSGGWLFYGLGWYVEYGRHGEVWSHAGAFRTGARTIASLIPAEQLGITVLSNAFPTGVPESLADTFFDLVLTGTPMRDWVAAWNEIYAPPPRPAIEAAVKRYGTPPAAPLPARPLSAYAGTYANPYIGNAVVAERDGELEIRLGPDGKAAFPLSHFDRDVFTYRPTPAMPTMPFPVRFTTGPDQKATKVTIEDLNKLGLGVLTRTGD